MLPTAKFLMESTKLLEKSVSNKYTFYVSVFFHGAGGVRNCQFWHNIVYGRPPWVLGINDERHVTTIFHVCLSRWFLLSKVGKWDYVCKSYSVTTSCLLRYYSYDLMYNYVQPLNDLQEILLLLTSFISRVLLLCQLCKRQLFRQIFNCWL